MSDPYNAKNELLKLQEQSLGIQDLLYKNRYRDYVYVNKKLANCSYASIVENNRINQQQQSCDSPFCPICAAIHKINREMAIAYGVVDKINAHRFLDNGRKSTPTLRFLTLTIPKVLPSEFEATFKQLKLNYKLFLNTEMQKKSDKWVSFAQSLRGHSVYYHLALSDDYAGNAVVGIHLHAILLLNPSFSGKNSVTEDMLNNCWRILNGERYFLQTKLKSLPTTYNHFKNTTKYGLGKFDFDEIIANPRKFLAVLPFIYRQRFMTHYGDLRTFRREVQSEYKKQRKIDLIADLEQLSTEEATAIAILP